ncbi:MAG: hypothetical protein A2148_01485 [Chloroflexi bacterium RBG_16_68_14]|nr:MAG: hypothetical protein A2148_01485 [Chloroflexi bacterium RBG_16_68_14]
MKLVAKLLLLAVVLGGASVALASTAGASHAKLEVVAPSQLTVGDSADVRVMLRSAGDVLPIAGATVTFYMEASFGGVDGEVAIGQAVTDENGVAVLPYQPRSSGDHQIRVEYLTPGTSEPEEAVWSHSVAGTTQQLYRSTAGVQIPGLNVWLLMAVLAGVWAILLSVALRVVAIARAGADVEEVFAEGLRIRRAAAVSATARLETTRG